jgi:flavin reductase ActVB
MKLDTFKEAMARFGSGVTVITTREYEGAPAGFTASSFSSLSLNPPLVLFCLDREAHCFDAFYGATHFGVNILASGQKDISNRFSQRSGDKFKDIGLLDGTTDVPLIEGSLVNLECRTTEKLPGGDHLIFIGEVEQVHLGEGAPLLFFMGKYHSI